MGPSPRRRTNLTLAYNGILVGRLCLYTVAHFVPTPAFANVHGALQVTALTVDAIVGLLWLHRAWTRVPAPSRRAYDGRRIEPGEALWKLFIPFYGLYWIFLANIGLCGAIERHLERAGARGAKAPSSLAFVACLVQLVPGLNLLVSPFLWGMFMTFVDASQAEAERLDPDTPPPAPLGLLKSLGIVVGALLLVWGALAVVYVALFKFLSPVGP